MSHTPEPWHEEFKNEDTRLLVCSKQENISLRRDVLGYFEMAGDGQRAIACVNGCAGLNPAAYRQVVEALTEIKQLLDTGQLVRNIDHDADADWHIRMTPFVKTINNVCIALALAEQQLRVLHVVEELVLGDCHCDDAAKLLDAARMQP